MGTKQSTLFEPKTVSKKNEGTKFDDLKNLEYKIIQFNFSQPKEFSHNRLYIC